MKSNMQNRIRKNGERNRKNIHISIHLDHKPMNKIRLNLNLKSRVMWMCTRTQASNIKSPNWWSQPKKITLTIGRYCSTFGPFSIICWLLSGCRFSPLHIFICISFPNVQCYISITKMSTTATNYIVSSKHFILACRIHWIPNSKY